jgi:Animal haem peroxidase
MRGAPFLVAAATLFGASLAQKSFATDKLNVYAVSGSVSDLAAAGRAVRFPDVIPNLFGGLLFDFKVNPKLVDAKTGKVYEYALQTPTDDRVTVWNLAEGAQATSFMFASHTVNAFQASLAGATFVLTVDTQQGTPRLTLACLARKADTTAGNEQQASLVTGLISTMLENARAAVGIANCSAEFSLHTGICNNVNRRGSSGSPVRYSCPSEPVLAGGSRGEMVQSKAPSPRVLSNAFCRVEGTSQRASRSPASFAFIIFGQFLDHDLTLTPEGAKMFRETAPILRGDADELSLPPMPFTRSEYVRTPGPNGYTAGTPRRHFNSLTSFVDASNVYGADNWRAWALRSQKDGKLRMRGDRDLPLNKLSDLPIVLRNAPSLDGSLFAAGDVRANENPVLLAMHTVFAREHNRICDLLKADVLGTPFASLAASDSWLYHQARKLLIGEMQNIVYREFLPQLLGADALPRYAGYQPSVDPSEAIAHSTAAFRFGHTGVVNDFLAKDRRGVAHTITFHKVFFNTSIYTQFGIEAWLEGAALKRAEEVDAKLVPSLQDFLFNADRAGILDLASLNIQRTRDHGVCSYTRSRASFGLATNLNDIPPADRMKMLNVYPTADDIDVIVGGLSETPQAGSMLGPLYHRVNVDQFTRSRDGDRFYYENPDLNYGAAFAWLAKNKAGAPSLLLSQRIKAGGVRLRDVFEANTDVRLPGTGSVMKMAR